jgi:hypothetical protein
MHDSEEPASPKPVTRVIINMKHNTATVFHNDESLPPSPTTVALPRPQERRNQPQETEKKQPNKKQDVVFVDDTYTAKGKNKIMKETPDMFKKKENNFDDLTKMFKFK